MAIGSATIWVDLVATLQISPCNLCPRLCGAERALGQVGFCGANDKLYVARAALHFWEEPPLSGVRGSGAVFFTNCSLHCVYCQNAEIAAGSFGKAVSVERLAQIFLELQEQGALNINCVTPTHYALAIKSAVALARDQGMRLPVVWNTSGYERTDAICELADTVDIYLTDFKYATTDAARAYSNAPDYVHVARAALDTMVETAGEPRFDEVDGAARMTRGVVVRHLLLPGELGESKRVLALLHERYEGRVLVSIMNQYTPVLASAAQAGNAQAKAALARFPHLAQRVDDETYERLLDYADQLGMDDYFWQEGPASLESFVPAWDATGV